MDGMVAHTCRETNNMTTDLCDTLGQAPNTTSIFGSGCPSGSSLVCDENGGIKTYYYSSVGLSCDEWAKETKEA